MKKNNFIVIVGVIVGLIVGYTTHGTTPAQVKYVNVGAIGDTQATPKIAQIQGNAATGAYSSADNAYLFATVNNSNSADRTIISIDTFYSGLNAKTSTTSPTASNFLVRAATSTDTTTLGGNTNLVYQSSVATSSAVYYEASSTPGMATANLNRIWPAGTSINFVSAATTSANVWLRVSYIQQ